MPRRRRPINPFRVIRGLALIGFVLWLVWDHYSPTGHYQTRQRMIEDWRRQNAEWRRLNDQLAAENDRRAAELCAQGIARLCGDDWRARLDTRPQQER